MCCVLKRNLIIYILLLTAVVSQMMILRSEYVVNYGIQFATSLLSFNTIAGNILMVFYSFIPIPFILFVFWGDVHEIVVGYGKLFVIRNYSKSILMMKTIGKTSLKLLIIIGTMYLISVMFMAKPSVLNWRMQLVILLMYYGIILSVILLEYILELFVESQYANLAINVFVVISLILGSYTDCSSTFARVLFPNLAFANRNGIFCDNSIVPVMIFTVIIIIIFIIISCGVYRKRDVF